MAWVSAATATRGGGKSASPAPTSIKSTPCWSSRRLIAGNSAIGYPGSAASRLENSVTSPSTLSLYAFPLRRSLYVFASGIYTLSLTWEPGPRQEHPGGVCDGIDRDQQPVARQRLHPHHGARRRVARREVRGAGVADRLQVGGVEVHHVHGEFGDVGRGRAGDAQHLGQVGERLRGLRLEIARTDEVAEAVEGHLARDVHGRAHLHGVREPVEPGPPPGVELAPGPRGRPQPVRA